MRLRYNNPKMVARKMNGKYPRGLTFGFEAELESKYDIERDDYWDMTKREKRANEVLQDMECSYKNFYFFKSEGSLDDGLEVVSHPFNWNWLQKHSDAIDWFSDLQKNGFQGKRTCGFHVHIGRNYFGKAHLKKMLKLYYYNEKFIKKVSKRNGDMLFCDPTLKPFVEYGSSTDSTLTTPNDLVKRSKCFWGGIDKHCALNLYPKNTIEVRIFRGTSNKKLIWAYLEFVKASVMFTEVTALKDIDAKNFKRYVIAKKKEYPHAVSLIRNPAGFKF